MIVCCRILKQRALGTWHCINFMYVTQYVQLFHELYQCFVRLHAMSYLLRFIFVYCWCFPSHFLLFNLSACTCFVFCSFVEATLLPGLMYTSFHLGKHPGNEIATGSRRRGTWPRLCYFYKPQRPKKRKQAGSLEKEGPEVKGVG